MKVTFEIDTDREGANLCEFEQLKSASDMAAALWELSQLIHDWLNHPEDIKPLNADTLYEMFYHILDDNGVNLDKIWR